MEELAQKDIQEIASSASPLSVAEANEYLAVLSGWELTNENKKIRKEITCDDFVSALEVVNLVGDIAEEAQHHPDIHVYYNTVVIELWTHTINGLSSNDFIVAARIDSQT